MPMPVSRVARKPLILRIEKLYKAGTHTYPHNSWHFNFHSRIIFELCTRLCALCAVCVCGTYEWVSITEIRGRTKFVDADDFTVSQHIFIVHYCRHNKSEIENSAVEREDVRSEVERMWGGEDERWEAKTEIGEAGNERGKAASKRGKAGREGEAGTEKQRSRVGQSGVIFDHIYVKMYFNLCDEYI